MDKVQALCIAHQNKLRDMAAQQEAAKIQVFSDLESSHLAYELRRVLDNTDWRFEMRATGYITFRHVKIPELVVEYDMRYRRWVGLMSFQVQEGAPVELKALLAGLPDDCKCN